jgi:hypothetical protein
MTDESHDIRMQLGQNAMDIVDAVDDELLALLKPAVETVNALATHMRLSGALSSRQVFNMLIGLLLEGAFDFDDA